MLVNLPLCNPLGQAEARLHFRGSASRIDSEAPTRVRRMRAAHENVSVYISLGGEVAGKGERGGGPSRAESPPPLGPSLGIWGSCQVASSAALRLGSRHGRGSGSEQ